MADLSSGLVNITEIYNRSIKKEPKEMSNKELFGCEELEVEEILVKPIRKVAGILYSESPFYKRLNSEERNYFLFTIAECLEVDKISADFIGFTFGIEVGKDFIEILLNNKIINKKGRFLIKD